MRSKGSARPVVVQIIEHLKSVYFADAIFELRMVWSIRLSSKTEKVCSGCVFKSSDLNSSLLKHAILPLKYKLGVLFFLDGIVFLYVLGKRETSVKKIDAPRKMRDNIISEACKCFVKLL